MRTTSNTHVVYTFPISYYVRTDLCKKHQSITSNVSIVQHTCKWLQLILPVRARTILCDLAYTCPTGLVLNFLLYTVHNQLHARWKGVALRLRTG